VPVLRRGSGGGTVLLGPGCLNYAVALPFAADPRLRDVGASMAILLTRIGESLGVRLRGTSDLVWGDRKVSGNAQRRGHKALLLHGTILYDFDVETFGRYLREPERQPSYRAGRRHSQFVCNLPMAAEQIRVRIASCFPPACSR
jgi:lipoate-protein ligase A